MVRREPVAERPRRALAPAMVGVAVGPLLLGTLLMAGYQLGAAVGTGPMASGPARTISESALEADAATVLRRLREGQDPNAPARVSAVRLDGGPRDLLPLEAAVVGGDDLTVEILQRYGARLAPDHARRVACTSAGRGRPGVARMIAGEGFDPASCGEDPSK